LKRTTKIWGEGLRRKKINCGQRQKRFELQAGLIGGVLKETKKGGKTE